MTIKRYICRENIPWCPQTKSAYVAGMRYSARRWAVVDGAKAEVHDPALFALFEGWVEEGKFARIPAEDVEG